MKILTLGKGFVSQHLPYDSTDYRIEPTIMSVRTVLDAHKPDVIVNCIGKTGTPNVDWCESNKSITAETNAVLPVMLAKECADRNIHMVHIGSGCIFYGKSPNSRWYTSEVTRKPVEVDFGWKETDAANPESFYSKTKAAADLVLGDMDNVAVLRIRMPISSIKVPRNLISKLIKYDKVIDIPNSVTFMDDLVSCVDWAINNKVTGIWHVTNPQTLTAAQIMKEYQKYVPNHKFRTISEEELGSLTVAKRSNCVLNTEKLRNAGFQMSLAEDALKKCMSEYIKNI
jgi:dTDP-4-dehydrorhamnose reductase